MTLDPLAASRMPPFDEPSEIAVIASVMLEGQRAFDASVAIGIVAESFYVPRNAVVWACLADLSSQGRATDAVTAGAYLNSHGDLEGVGGINALLAMIDGTPTATSVEHYAEIVMERYARRRIIEAARSIERAAFTDADSTAEDIRSKGEFDLSAIKSERRRVRTPREVLSAAMENVDRASVTGCVGLPLGFRIFDTFCGGALPQSLIFISGKAAAGKTTLSRNCAENVARAGGFVGIFSMEQSEDAMWLSIAATRARMSLYHLFNHRLSPEERARLDEAREVVADYPIGIDDMPQTIHSIRSRVRQWAAKHDCKLVVIDYIQAIREHMKFKSVDEKLTAISAELRDLAKETGIPMLILSALSYEGNLRGSGMLGYDAWVHVSLEKKGETNKETGVTTVEVKFEKGRFAPPARPETIYLIGNEGRFCDLEPSEEFDPKGDL